MDEEEHELSLSASFTLLEETHDPTPMEPTLGRSFTFIDLEDELVHHTSSYTATSFSLHPSEVWVKGFFLLVHMRSMRLLLDMMMLFYVHQSILSKS